MKRMGVMVSVFGMAAAACAHAADFPWQSRVGDDPAGILESTWLDAVLSAESRRMSSLGIGSALSGDRAEVRTRDFSLTEPVSGQFSYIGDPFDPHFKRVVRLSLLRSVPTEEGRAVNMSATLGAARGARLAPGVRMRNLFSARTALSVPIGESLRADFRVSYLSGTGVRSRFMGPSFETRDPAAIAVAASLDYSHTNWHAGPFVQWSKAGADVVNVAGVSAAWRVTTRATAYAAYYGYRFSEIDTALPPVNTAGSAVIVGFDYRL
jgi:hypothetical protein